jgi:2,3,4,5-tetrahydropyridine-2-carboxylate N-succinyltransferase
VRDAVQDTIERLDRGEIRVAEKRDGDWVVNDWIKKAVLLSFRIEDNAFIKGGFTNYYDKVPSKYAEYNAREFRDGGVRVVPPAAARRGSYIAPSCVLMPSYVNIGAYVDSGTMVDTWATVGSCAQIGRNVHLSGGVGIGGVLEPVQAAPTIIEDNCFIGARSEVVEGVIVGEGAVLSMGVFIGQSTKIFSRETGEIPRRPRGGRGGARQPALQGRQLLSGLRRHHQTGGRPHPRQDQHQRAAAGYLIAPGLACPRPNPPQLKA